MLIFLLAGVGITPRFNRKRLEHIILPGIDIGSKNSQSAGYDLCPGYWPN